MIRHKQNRDQEAMCGNVKGPHRLSDDWTTVDCQDCLEHLPTIDTLIEKIKTFLEVRVPSVDNNLARLGDTDVSDMHDIIDILSFLKYERSPCCGFPITAHLVDKTKYRSLRYVPVPYDIEEDLNSKYRRIRAIQLNRTISDSEVDQFFRLYIDDIAQELKDAEDKV